MSIFEGICAEFKTLFALFLQTNSPILLENMSQGKHFQCPEVVKKKYQSKLFVGP